MQLYLIYIMNFSQYCRMKRRQLYLTMARKGSSCWRVKGDCPEGPGLVEYVEASYRNLKGSRRNTAIFEAVMWEGVPYRWKQQGENLHSYKSKVTPANGIFPSCWGALWGIFMQPQLLKSCILFCVPSELSLGLGLPQTGRAHICSFLMYCISSSGNEAVTIPQQWRISTGQYQIWRRWKLVPSLTSFGVRFLFGPSSCVRLWYIEN